MSLWQRRSIVMAASQHGQITIAGFHHVFSTLLSQHILIAACSNSARCSARGWLLGVLYACMCISLCSYTQENNKIKKIKKIKRGIYFSVYCHGGKFQITKIINCQ